jgi:predicted enzyme related to lactoylglutathione lyase
MAELTSYPHGTPCWVDVTSPDLEKTIEFYGGLFGWEAEQDPRPEAGGYTMFTLDGKYVAAATPPPQEGMPSNWTTYIASDDVDDTAGRVRDAGGSVLADPFDVFDAGRMTVVEDPTGAIFGVWQAGTHHGAQLTNDPGTLTWNECQTAEPETAAAFYETVFGHQVGEMPGASGQPYRMLKVDDKAVAGILELTPEMKAGGVPPNWSTIFAVADTEAALSLAGELGGEKLMGPMVIPEVGILGVIKDPVGAVFQVIAPPEKITS